MMPLKKFLSLSKNELEEFLLNINFDAEIIESLYHLPAFDLLGISGYRTLQSSIIKKSQLPLNITITQYGVYTCTIFVCVPYSDEHVEIVYNYRIKEVRRILYFNPSNDIKWVESMKDIKWVDIDIPQTLISDGEKRNSNN